jgi:hypothetical protein
MAIESSCAGKRLPATLMVAYEYWSHFHSLVVWSLTVVKLLWVKKTLRGGKYDTIRSGYSERGNPIFELDPITIKW